MPANLESLDFTPFYILSAHGQQYCGVRPSMIPKPFKSVVVTFGGETYCPGLPEGYLKKDVVGYDAAIRVGMNLTSAGKKVNSDMAYRMITILKDGKKWFKSIGPGKQITEDWM